MDERTIEIKVERMTDRTDKRYMNGELSEVEYRAEMDRISKWADEMIGRVLFQ